jgi:regulator of sirC expression with transglutaminase-like and TPR domain
VRLAGEPGDLLLDPFQRGMSVHEEDCRRILQEVTGGKLEFREELLVSVSKRDMIARLLLNLKGAYLRKDLDEQALAAVDRLLLLHPDDTDEIRDRGLLLYRLHRHGAALEALASYLESRPEAPDRETIAEHVLALRKIIAQLN